MAKFTDIFIKRPVLATVISLLIFIVGLRAIYDLPVREFPKLTNTVITITTTYPGASANVVQGFITAPLEKAIAGAEGIDYVTAESGDSVSTISAYIKLNYDPNIAFTDIMSMVQQTKGDLPTEANEPVLTKQTGSQIALMYIGFKSTQMSPEQITDYVSRVVQPRLESLDGVAQAQVLGGNVFAMRIWLDTQRMAGLRVTPNDVYAALKSNNVPAAAGHTQGKYIQISLNPKTDLNTISGFKDMVIKAGKNGAFVRLKDVAVVELGSQNYDSSIYFNGEKAVFIGVTATPSANPLTVIASVNRLLPAIQAQLPPMLKLKVVYDATKYIRTSVHEVMYTLLEATIIVVIVIFLFLGSLRTVIIPVITIPLSLVGVCALMSGLGYSINLLTLLAMVLAIGMVVDDAIVVVENIYRHIEAGMQPKEAAIQGAREIALPIISMTLTLAAVYAPIGLMGGLTGALFKEFAFTLACAVIISGIIALTLSPMMCSRVLSTEISKHRLVHLIDNTFDNLKQRYQKLLHETLGFIPTVILFAFVVLVSCVFLYSNSKHELAPQEDKGAVFVFAQGPQSASLAYMEKFTQQFNRIYRSIPAMEDYFIGNGMQGVNSALSAIILKPWNKRTQSAQQVNQILQKDFNALPGLQINSFPLPPLPTTGSDIPLQFVVTSIDSFNLMHPVVEKLVQDAQNSGLFLFISSSLKFDKPQIDLEINRSKAAELGIGMQDIAQALATSFGGNNVGHFSVEGRSYQVIPQVLQRFRYNPHDIGRIYVKTASNQLVPLSLITKVVYSIQPNSLSEFNQMNAVTLQGMMMPGHSLSEGLQFLRNDAKKIFPSDFSFNYAGQSRQFIQEGATLAYTFFFSIIFIFLVLAAQFESFRDPLVIMTSVPMAICGALLPMNWGFASVNIYTQIGLITLVGLITKHGILMVEFANQLRRHEGLSMHEAIEKAAAIRLRPVLMTTFSMVLGVLPLLTAVGPGAVSRFDIGLVVAAGMCIGTLFTLFVVPTMYVLKARQILLFLLSVCIVVIVLYFM